MNFVIVVGLFLKNRLKTCLHLVALVRVCERAFLYVEGSLRGRGSCFLDTERLFLDGF